MGSVFEVVRRQHNSIKCGPTRRTVWQLDVSSQTLLAHFAAGTSTTGDRNLAILVCSAST